MDVLALVSGRESDEGLRLRHPELIRTWSASNRKMVRNSSSIWSFVGGEGCAKQNMHNVCIYAFNCFAEIYVCGESKMISTARQ